MDELTPNVIDVPLSTMDQAPPAHGGPIGRVQSLKDAEVVHYLPPQAGGAGGGSSPQTVSIQQREGFVSLAVTEQDVATGNPLSLGFPPAELLSTLGNQLLSIANSRPKVWNDTNWSTYVDSRVLTGQLSQDILHTSNKTIQASDSAVIGDVTCAVWTETNEGLTSSYIGFRGADGAWIVTPRLLYASASTSSIAMAKVASDGTRFWVVYDNASANLQIATYDTNGTFQALTTKVRRWTTSPGFWDIIVAIPNSGHGADLILAQPASYVPGTDVHVDFTRFASAAGPSITQTSNIDTSVHCTGPVAWLTNVQGFSTFQYLATVAVGAETTLDVWAYEVNTFSLVQTHQYLVTPALSILNGNTIDAMTGYIISSSGIGVVVAVSFLSEYTVPAGPPNDPGLRSVRVYACTRSGVQVFVKQANGVVLQSRAFLVPTSPPEAADFYAVTYYQSGGGLLPEQAATSIAIDEGDFMTGQLDQELTVVSGDAVTGAPHQLDLIAGSITTIGNTKPIASITHNVGDSATGATSTWVFNNADFTSSGWTVDCRFGFLNVSGSAVTNNNQSYFIVKVVNSHTIITESTGSLGHPISNDTLVGVTASVTSTVYTYVLGDAVPRGLVNQFLGGSLALANLFVPGDNGTYTIRRIVFDIDGGLGRVLSVVICAGTLNGGAQVLDQTATSTATISPVFPYLWIFQQETFTTIDQGNNLVVTGTSGSINDGEFLITNNVSNAVITSAQPTLLPEIFVPTLPKMVIHLLVTPLTFTFQLFSFDDSFRGAFLTISGASHPANNGTYIITTIVSVHVVTVISATGATGQRNEFLQFGSATATITRSQNNSPAYQPCWLLTPLTVTQQIAGRFEYGVAYADWRFDGQTTNVNIGTDFNRNHFPFALSSVPTAGAVDSLVALPFRAQSFTAGQVVRSGPNIVGVAAVQESTVGLKQFTLAGARFGQAVGNSGELLLPGPMGAAFTASGFHEDGVSFGFEQPFLVSQSVTAGIIGLTLKTSYQVVAVAEVMDENGDRTFSLPSPPLDFTLTGTNNTATYGGRLIGPTNRTLVGIALYRTSFQGGAPTVQHYKATDDLDVNGTGFTFSNVNIGIGTLDTWQFVDTAPDVGILSSEILYTDKALTPRYPAPAFKQGVGSWCNRTWVIGYDGAVWMSGEKTEGDAVWFTPLFRYVLPTDDRPVALAALDEYMLVFCSRSIWYIPKTDFIAANLQSGSLPTPVQLPFQNGCTGWALTIRSGVAYGSTAGGVWLITRQLTNVWLSQPVQDDLDSSEPTTLTIDERQRLGVWIGSTRVFVFDQVSGCWAVWNLPGAAALGTTLEGRFTYQDLVNPGHVARQAAGVFADTIGVTTTAIPPDVQLAGVSMAGVRSYKRAWAIQIVGQYKGPHRLNVVVSYPDEDQDDTTYEPFTPAADEAYIFEVNPDPEEASTFSVRIFADFVGVNVPGNSFLLELLSFEVGLESNINRLSSAKRIPSNS